MRPLRSRLAPALGLLLAPVLGACLAAQGSAGGPEDDGTDGASGSRPESRGRAGTLRITSPAPGDVFSNGELTVTGAANVEEATEVMVNGSAVPIDDGRFETDLSIEEGPATIEATVADLRATVQVIVDKTDPVLTITEPTPGSFIEGETLRVSGTVDDATLKELTVDGERVHVGPDGGFHYEQRVDPGAYRVRVRAEDEAGQSAYAFTAALVGEYLPDDEEHRNAMSFKMGHRALDALESAGEDHIGRRDLEADLMRYNPIVSEWWGEVHAIRESHDSIEVQLTPNDGHLFADVIVHDVRVDFELYPSVGGTVSGYVTASSAVASVPAQVLAVDGRPEVNLGGTYVELRDFRFRMDHVPSFIEDSGTVRNYLRSRIRQAVTDAVEGTVPGWLENALGQIPRGRIVQVDSTPVYVSGGLYGFDVRNDGIRARLNLGIRAFRPKVERGERAPGILLLGRGRLPDPRTDGVSAAAALDLVNAISHAAWASGSFDVRIDRPPFSGGSLEVRHLAALMPSLKDVAPEDSPVSLIVSPELPAVASPAGMDGVEIHAPDVRVEVVAPVDGEDRHLLTLSLGVTAPVTFDVVSDRFELRVGEIEFVVDPVDGPSELPNAPRLESLLEAPLSSVASTPLDLGSLPIPSMYGFSIYGAEATIDGSYVTFDGNLRYTR